MKWRERLVQPVDGASLGLFRWLWGALMIWEAVMRLPKADGMYSPEYFHFTYSLFPFVKPLPAVWMMQVEIGLMVVAAVLLTTGYFYRLSCACFLAIFTHLFLIEKLYYNNHFYLTILMGFLMLISQADRCYRLPLPWKSSVPPSVPKTVPLWNLILLRSQVVVLYFFGGVAKLNSDWLAGEPIRYWFAQKGPDHILAPLLTQEWFVMMVCWTGLILDLVAGFGLLSKRTRGLTMALLVVFHATNSLIFKIGLFPLIGISLLVLFIEPDRPRRIAAWVRSQWNGRTSPIQKLPNVLSSKKLQANWALTLFVSGWIVVQVLIPLRILGYPQNPGWTEVGQCFSWRMMLRSKDAFLQFEFQPREVETYLEEHPHLLPHISQAHLNQMVKSPHFILQYAHALHQSLEREGIKDVQIKCISIASMNGRPYQLMIDPETNLAESSFGFFKVPEWIVPLDQNRRPGQYPESPVERTKIISQVYRDYLQENRKQKAPEKRSPVRYAEAPEYSGSLH